MSKEGNKPEPVTSLTLYADAQNLISELEMREGVTDDELEDAIEQFLDGSESKLDRHRYAIDMMSTKAKMYRAEAQRLAARSRMVEGIVERIKQHAKLVMEARVDLLGEADGRKMETEHGIVYLRKSKRLVIEDPDQFIHLNRKRNDWFTWKATIDKRAVKAALEADEDVDLAYIESNTSVVFK